MSDAISNSQPSTCVTITSCLPVCHESQGQVQGMFKSFNNRLGHYALLLAVAGVLIFPHLGRPSLWDIDEGNNAEAAREMMESENWIIPTFNYQLRVDKPALLYWLQIAGYRMCGVN